MFELNVLRGCKGEEGLLLFYARRTNVKYSCQQLKSSVTDQRKSNNKKTQVIKQYTVIINQEQTATISTIIT